MQVVGQDREKITEGESCALSLSVTTSLPVPLAAEFVDHVLTGKADDGLSAVLRTRFRPGLNQRFSWPAEPESLGPAIAETNSRMSPCGLSKVASILAMSPYFSGVSLPLLSWPSVMYRLRIIEHGPIGDDANKATFD